MNTLAALSVASLTASSFCSMGVRDYEGTPAFLFVHAVVTADVTDRAWSYGDMQLVFLESSGTERRLPGRQRRALVQATSGGLKIQDVFIFDGTIEFDGYGSYYDEGVGGGGE